MNLDDIALAIFVRQLNTDDIAAQHCKRFAELAASLSYEYAAIFIEEKQRHEGAMPPRQTPMD